MDDITHQRLVALENRMARVENNAAPTIPSLDSTNFPQDAVYGQIVKDQFDHSVWVYGEDDTWHKVGGGKLGAYAKGIYNYPTDTSLNAIPGGTVAYVPFNSFRASTDQNAIKFGGGSYPPTGPPYTNMWLAGDYDHGGIYTFFAGVHIASANYVNVGILIHDTSHDEFVHMGFMPHNFGDVQVFNFTSVLGLATHEDFAQIFVWPGASAGAFGLLIQNEDSNPTQVGWAHLTCFYTPTDTPDTSLNPNAIDVGYAL